MNVRNVYRTTFVLPAFILYTVLFIIPVIAGIGFSLTDWNTIRPEIKYVGLANYIDIFRSEGGPYLQSIIHTFLFTFFTVLIKSLLGLILALVLNEGLKTKNQLRTLFFLPYTLSPLIIGISFVSLLSPDGPLNSILRTVGLGSFTHSWLSDPQTVLATTIGVETWRMAGWNMVIFLAGLQMISKEYYEAAAIDGAGPWTQLKSITIPFLMPSITMTLVLNTIHGLRVFDIIYALTGGGPGALTEVINTQVFKEFGDGRYGMANALSVLVFIATFAIALSMKRVLTGEEAETR